MAGKIHEKAEFWKETLNSSDFVNAVIQNGYSLPFVKECPSFQAKNNASSLRNYEFVTEAIEDLLKTKCIIQTDTIPHCCNPLTVSEGQKLRLVLDLRHVNNCLQEFKFRYENLNTVKKIFESGYYFCCFDLKSGYHHIKIKPEDWQYLGFSWTYRTGVTLYFVFVVCPFGLSTACYLFTKIMRPLVKKWRGSGIRCVVYLDDGIFGSLWKRVTAKHSVIIKSDLENAGFTLNEDKSILEPVQKAIFLGFLIDTVAFKFSVPEEKLEKLKSLILSALHTSQSISARQVAKIAGSIISMGPGIGPLTRLFTRKMYQFIDETPTWDRGHNLGSGAYEEMAFWLKNLNQVNGFAIKEHHVINKIIYSDASDHAYGGYVMERLGNKIVHGVFSNEEKEKSSTYRELVAVKYVLQSFANNLRHQVVLWHSDNANTAKIINNGSPKDDLQALAIDIFETSLQFDIQIVSKWIPREENEEADAISKFYDTDSWGIDDETFDFIQAQFGRVTVDRFASSTNRKLARFDARFYCPGVENVNTFTSHWGQEFNWLCPPISLIGEALKHAKRCKSEGVLLVPEWKSAYFWPLITPDGEKFYPFVLDYLVLDPFYINDCKNGSVFTGFVKFRSLALLFSFCEYV